MPITSPEPPALFTEFSRYAFTIAARAGTRFPWLADDFVSDALLALWRLAENPDIRPGPIKGLVAFIVHRAINSRVRIEWKKNPAAFRRAGPVRSDNGTELDAVALLADPREPTTAMGFDELLAMVPDNARELVRRHFEAGTTFEELGTESGVTGGRINQRVLGAVRKLAAAVS
jgi:RNA polymerase sigma factor (sigma-70 family)